MGGVRKNLAPSKTCVEQRVTRVEYGPIHAQRRTSLACSHEHGLVLKSFIGTDSWAVLSVEHETDAEHRFMLKKSFIGTGPGLVVFALRLILLVFVTTYWPCNYYIPMTLVFTWFNADCFSQYRCMALCVCFGRFVFTVRFVRFVYPYHISFFSNPFQAQLQ